MLQLSQLYSNARYESIVGLEGLIMQEFDGECVQGCTGLKKRVEDSGAFGGSEGRDAGDWREMKA